MLVGLREASPAEAAVLKESRITVFTMADIDALGMRDVMREAMRIATTGTRRIPCQLFADRDRDPGLGRRFGRHDGARDASGDGS